MSKTKVLATTGVSYIPAKVNEQQHRGMTLHVGFRYHNQHQGTIVKTRDERYFVVLNGGQVPVELKQPWRNLAEVQTAIESYYGRGNG